MLLLRLLSATALLGVALGQIDFAVLAKFPTCTVQCSTEVLTPAGCAFTDLRNCLCTSDDLQYKVSACVMSSCNVTEQYTSLTILQTEVCNGVPQPSRNHEAIRASIILASVTFPIIFLRFVSRLVIARRVWWDDWTILGAAIMMVPMTLLPIYPAGPLGMGKHFYTIPPANIISLFKIFYAFQLLYVVAQVSAKMSILLLYLRIFPSPRFRFILTVSMTIMVCHGLAFLFVVAFQCLPVRSIWDRDVPGKCVNLQAIIYAGAGLSIFEDLAIMLLPVWELKGLNLSRRKRIALGFMFALGSFACITSIIRLKFVTSFGTTLDQTWNYIDVLIWSQIETYTAVICACLMCIRPLILKYLPGVFPTTVNSHNTTNKSWGQKFNSRSRQSRQFAGGIELTGEEGLARPSKASTRQITVTTESRVSYEMKDGSYGTKSSHELEDNDNETMASSEGFAKR